MSTVTLFVFLLLFGITNLVDTKIPPWLLGFAALAAAAAQVYSKVSKGDSK